MKIVATWARIQGSQKHSVENGEISQCGEIFYKISIYKLVHINFKLLGRNATFMTQSELYRFLFSKTTRSQVAWTSVNWPGMNQTSGWCHSSCVITPIKIVIMDGGKNCSLSWNWSPLKGENPQIDQRMMVCVVLEIYLDILVLKIKV